MQTRRAYLVSKGLAKDGRGKFSTEAKAELDRARAAGMAFSDEVVTVVAQPTGEVKTEVKAKPKTEVTPWKSPDEYRYPENLYRAFVVVEKKRVQVGMREACQTCGLSLCDHRCATPIVLGQAVTIERAA